MTPNKKSSSQSFNLCAGKECQNIGIHSLEVRYVHKKGWFCDSCTNNLVADNLVEEKRIDHNHLTQDLESTLLGL
jgi:hypothetical protein